MHSRWTVKGSKCNLHLPVVDTNKKFTSHDELTSWQTEA